MRQRLPAPPGPTAASLRPLAVLVPADVRRRSGPRPAGGEAAPQPGKAGGGLFSSFRWGAPAPAGNTESTAAAEGGLRRANEVPAPQEVTDKAWVASTDILPFLRPVGVMEMRYIRMLSNLSALTYCMDKLTPSALSRRHRLRLVTSSRVCERQLRDALDSPRDVFGDSDAMAADPGMAFALRQALEAGGGSAQEGAAAALQALSRLESVSAAFSPSRFRAAAAATANSGGSPGGAATRSRDGDLATAAAAAEEGGSAAERVSRSLSAAVAAAAAAAQGAYSAAGSVASPLANNITSFTSGVASATPVQTVWQQLQVAAAAGHSTTMAAMTTVAAALEATWQQRERRNAALALPAAATAALLPKDCQSPTEWFVADDAPSHTRYFVIQGSDSFDHWRVNLTFDPVEFEDPELGVKVHRGVYETAQQLYQRFRPLVEEHLAASPFAKIAFTGHSLGGSLGTLLVLMFVRRGVLPAGAVAPVYTFGAPAIFCEGAVGACGSGCGACSLEEAAAARAAHDSRGLLQRLGLSIGAVRNVVMHRDIVPRAFACDYSPVAELLRRVGPSFREHRCLSGDRQVMFSFVGKMMVLQPAEELRFVAAEGGHPMLPPGAGLYALREPGPLDGVAVTLRRDARAARAVVRQAADKLRGAAEAAAAAAGGAPALLAALVEEEEAATVAAAPPPAVDLREAIWSLMNSPHPLETLAEPAAYGPLGAISRYHNPDNYTRALGAALHSRGDTWRRLARNAAAVGLRFQAPPAAWPPGPNPPAAPAPTADVPPSPTRGGKAAAPPLHRISARSLAARRTL